MSVGIEHVLALRQEMPAFGDQVEDADMGDVGKVGQFCFAAR